MQPLRVWAMVIMRSRALASLLVSGVLLVLGLMCWPLVQVRLTQQAVVEEFTTQVASFSGLAGMAGFLGLSLVALELGQRIAVGTGVRELLDSKRDALQRTQAGVVILTALLVVGLTSLLEATTVVGARQLGFSDGEVRNLALATALNVVVPSVIGLLLGFNAALLRSRAASYSLIIATLLVISPVFQRVASGLIVLTSTRMSDAFILLAAPVLRVLELITPDIGWRQDSLYLAPVEFSRWTLALVWLAALAIPLLVGRSPKSRLLVWLLSIAVLGPSWVASSRLDSVPRHDRSPSSVAYGLDYLESYAAEGIPAAVGEATAKAGGRVAAYELQLTIDRRLSARVKMTVVGGAGGGTGVTPFTLFRGYRVSRVTDGSGVDLAFSQVGDVVRVVSEGSGDYVFEYEGSGWRFYSNHQGTFLPGTFPWYPWLGEQRYFDGRQAGRPFLAPEKPALFKVSMDSASPVFSNVGALSLTPRSGEACGLTLVGGNVAQRTANNWTYVGPAATSPEIDPEDVRRELLEVSGRCGIPALDPPPRLVLFFGSTMSNADGRLGFPLVSGDQVIASADSSADFLTRQIAVGLVLRDISPDRESSRLFELTRDYMVDPGTFLEMYRVRPKAVDDGMGGTAHPSPDELLAWEFASAIRRKGDKHVVPRILEYLRGSSAGPSPAEYITSL